MMKLHLRIATCLAAWAASSVYAQTPAERFVDSLMAQMSWQEKIGQLNLPSVGFDVTGPMLSTGVEEKMKQGLVGA